MLGITSDYYDGPEVVDGLIEELRVAGLDPDALDIDELAPLDEFHARGRAATMALAALAGVQLGERVLDVGAGIGGPARVLAARLGAQVTALDATPRFCALAERLTRGAGLSDRVRVVCGDALELPFDDDSFDLAWTQAVAQNIADKERLVAELARVVMPGGRVAMFEIVAGPGGPIEFPVPWADRPDQSWLVPAGELRRLLDTGPLEIVHFEHGQAALEAIGAAQASVVPPGSNRGVGLHLLMPDYAARMATMLRNVAQQRVELVLAVARRTR
ncbi:MAG: methyltransferase domain-containing protein [Solirubrobacteraceae bacterium]